MGSYKLHAAPVHSHELDILIRLYLQCCFLPVYCTILVRSVVGNMIASFPGLPCLQFGSPGNEASNMTLKDHYDIT